MTYWRNEDYYGLGAGAHGYIGRQRHVNIKGVNPYNETANQGLPRLESFEVSREEAMEDFLMVGLRVLDGVSRDRFRQQFGISMEEVFAGPLNKMIGAGLLDSTDDGYKLSSKAFCSATMCLPNL